MRVCLLLVLAVGCGRVRFDPRADFDPLVDSSVPLHSGPPRTLLVGGPRGAVVMWTAWVQARSSVVVSLPTSTLLDDTSLANSDVIVFLNLTRTYAAAEADALGRFVDRGGSVVFPMAYVGDMTEVDRANTLVVAFDIGIVHVFSLDGPVTELEDHPVNAGLSSVPFIGGFEVVPVSSSATATARLGGRIVAAVQSRGQGRVYVWADERVILDASWASESMVWWENAFAWVWPTS